MYAPGIVLLDIMIPGMDGYQVCQQMRAEPELEDTKIILISGKQALKDRLKGYEAGADDYLKKPFDKKELLAKISVFARLFQEEKKSRRVN